MNCDISSYRGEGYVLLNNFWDTDDLQSVHDEAKAIFLSQIARVVDVPDKTLKDQATFDQLMFKFFSVDQEAFINCGKQVQHLISLHRLSLQEKLVALLRDVGLDFPIVSVRPSMFFNSRHLDSTGHYWKLDAHQDWRSSQGSLDSVTIWFPYVNCDTQLGALQVIPKSHKWGLLESSKVEYYSKISEGLDEEKYLSVEMKAGDLLIFSSFLVHRSGTNVTDRIRWSSQFRFNNINESTFIARKFPNAFIYKPLENLLTPGFPGKEQLASFFK